MLSELVSHYSGTLEERGLVQGLRLYSFKDVTNELFVRHSPALRNIYLGFLPGALGFLAYEYGKESMLPLRDETNK